MSLGFDNSQGNGDFFCGSGEKHPKSPLPTKTVKFKFKYI